MLVVVLRFGVRFHRIYKAICGILFNTGFCPPLMNEVAHRLRQQGAFNQAAQITAYIRMEWLRRSVMWISA